MPRHYETRVFPYSQHQLFDLVSDIERYPEFLPWCVDLKVIERSADRLTAKMTVGAGSFKDSFVSIVSLSAPERITVKYGGGNLRHLVNEWHFKPVDNGEACQVDFMLSFSLKSCLLDAMMDMFFQTAFQRMVTSFERRAEALYKKGIENG